MALNGLGEHVTLLFLYPEGVKQSNETSETI